MKIITLLFISLPSLAYCQQYGHGVLKEDVIMTSDKFANKINYSVYYPPDYELSQTRKYPIIYFLSGAIDHNDWIRHGEVNKIFDALIEERKMPPFIGIMLCGSIYKSPDQWKNLFENSVIKIIEGRLRVLPEHRVKRAIIGFSFGGYYAIKSAIEMDNRFICSVSICPIYFYSKNRLDELLDVYQEKSNKVAIDNMINGINKLKKDTTTNFQLLISSDNNFAKDDFELIKREVINNPNAQIWIQNGEHDWDFAIRNLEPSLQFVGDVFFGKIKRSVTQ
jgi:enterochelin esterase-like enzyme